MIEEMFKRYLTFEIENDGDFDIEYLKNLLGDDDLADEIWDNFERYHAADFRYMVRKQVKSILRKNETK